MEKIRISVATERMDITTWNWDSDNIACALMLVMIFIVFFLFVYYSIRVIVSNCKYEKKDINDPYDVSGMD